MYDKQQIIAQHRDGISNRKIADNPKNHVSRNTVDKYVNEYEDAQAKFFAENPDADRNTIIPYGNDEYKEKREKFGTIVIESDLDAEPEDIYRAYASRWEKSLSCAITSPRCSSPTRANTTITP